MKPFPLGVVESNLAITGLTHQLNGLMNQSESFVTIPAVFTHDQVQLKSESFKDSKFAIDTV